MRVNIAVTQPDIPWIVGRLAVELVKGLPKYGVHAEINGRGKFDLLYQFAYGPPPGMRPAVGMFAHGFELVRRYAQQYDGHVVLNPHMRDALVQAGAKDPVVIEQAVDACFLDGRPKRFGVAGSVKKNTTRKGEALVAKMVEAGYDIHAWGTGWPCPIDSDRYEDLPMFFKGLDYYVVTSSEEGGCTPIIECMALSVPVISPRIGFAIHRPVLEYQVGSWESLHQVLRYLTEHRTYDDYARDYADYFRRVLAQS